MAFSEHERAANHAALKWFLARRSPPEQIRAQLDFGYAIVGHAVDLHEIRPDWRDQSIYRQRAFARVRYVRAQDHWRFRTPWPPLMKTATAAFLGETSAGPPR
jgi:hypothetical protein